MSKDIGIGIIGLGMGVSSFKLNAIPGSRLEVRGVCSARPIKEARKIIDEWGIDYYTNDHNELVSRKDIDVICIYSPDKMHFQQCKAALEAGKHVVVTKPITEKSEDAIKLAKISKKKNLKFLVGQTLRFEPQAVELKKIFDQDKFGKSIFIGSHYIHDMRKMYKLTPWRLQKKWIIGAGCHPIDAVRWFAGDISEVHAFGNNGGLSEYKGIDNFVINLKTQKGLIARVLLLIGTVRSPEPMMKISVFGKKGSGYATYTDNKGGFLKVLLDDDEKGEISSQFLPEQGLDIYGHTETVIRYMRYFEDCIVNDKIPEPDAEDGAKALIISEAVLKSIKEKRIVKIDNSFMD